jgi:flagellar hook-basal body complex protein FliE
MESTPINPNGLPALGSGGVGAPGSLAAGTPGFKEMFERYLGEVNELQLQADKAVRELATGKTDNLHQIVVAISEADLSFRLMMQVRNKLVEAYKEIMRMQV